MAAVTLIEGSEVVGTRLVADGRYYPVVSVLVEIQERKVPKRLAFANLIAEDPTHICWDRVDRAALPQLVARRFADAPDSVEVCISDADLAEVRAKR